MKYSIIQRIIKDNSHLLNGWAPTNSPSRSLSCHPTVLAPMNNINFQNVTDRSVPYPHWFLCGSGSCWEIAITKSKFLHEKKLQLVSKAVFRIRICKFLGFACLDPDPSMKKQTWFQSDPDPWPHHWKYCTVPRYHKASLLSDLNNTTPIPKNKKMRSTIKVVSSATFSTLTTFFDMK